MASNQDMKQHGGKRAGSGRKKQYETKRITVPLEILPKIQDMISDYKKKYQNNHITLRKEKPEKPKIPILNARQKRTLQKWLKEIGFVSNKRIAKKLTKTPALCQKTFIEAAQIDGELTGDIMEVCELYAVYD